MDTHSCSIRWQRELIIRLFCLTLRTNLKFFGAAVIVTIPCSASVAAKLSVRQDTDLQCALHESSWWPPSPALESNSFILWIKPFNSVWSCPWMLRQLISLPGSASQINGCAHRQFVEWRSWRDINLRFTCLREKKSKTVELAWVLYIWNVAWVLVFISKFLDRVTNWVVDEIYKLAKQKRRSQYSTIRNE